MQASPKVVTENLRKKKTRRKENEGNQSFGRALLGGQKNVPEIRGAHVGAHSGQ